LFNFKIVQIKKCSKTKTVQFLKIVQFGKIRSNSKNIKKTETKNGKLRKTSPEIKKPIRTSKNRIGIF
jgi:hypothetical protein